MKIETLVVDLRDRFCKKIIEKAKTQQEKGFSKLIVGALNDNDMINDIYQRVPAATRAAVKSRMALMTQRTYPKFLKSVEQKVTPKFKSAMVQYIESQSEEPLEEWKYVFLGHL